MKRTFAACCFRSHISTPWAASWVTRRKRLYISFRRADRNPCSGRGFGQSLATVHWRALPEAFSESAISRRHFTNNALYSSGSLARSADSTFASRGRTRLRVSIPFGAMCSRYALWSSSAGVRVSISLAQSRLTISAMVFRSIWRWSANSACFSPGFFATTTSAAFCLGVMASGANSLLKISSAMK
ncbi:hypothetical protein R69608_05881 [Paraburkholderia nemoris]|nr:hypothetical protein R69608_05881 [Paraburkholderia nemoris]